MTSSRLLTQIWQSSICTSLVIALPRILTESGRNRGLMRAEQLRLIRPCQGAVTSHPRVCVSSWWWLISSQWGDCSYTYLLQLCEKPTTTPDTSFVLLGNKGRICLCVQKAHMTAFWCFHGDDESWSESSNLVAPQGRRGEGRELYVCKVSLIINQSAWCLLCLRQNIVLLIACHVFHWIEYICG